MRLSIVTCGLPSAGNHGGAVAVWAIIRAARAHGHDVTVCSLYDTSDENPYRARRAANVAALKAISVPVEFIEASYPELRHAALQDVVSRFALLRSPPITRYFPWAFHAGDVDRVLRQHQPDAIFCYHFDALAAVYRTRIAPIMAVVGDLWHDPPRYRWALEPHSLRASCYEFVRRRGLTHVTQRLMRELLAPCAARGEFVAHYTEWIRGACSYDIAYCRIPIEDPYPHELPPRASVRSDGEAWRVVLLGNLQGTASRWGQRFLAREVLPHLDRIVSSHPLVLDVIGGGELDAVSASAFHSRSYVRLRGYVDDLTTELANADVFIEPTPIPLGSRTRIITAFAHGCAIVTHTANRAGIPEITDGGNALVASDGPSFAKAIVRLLDAPALADRLRAAARRTYEESFTVERAGGAIVTAMEYAAIRARS